LYRSSDVINDTCTYYTRSSATAETAYVTFTNHIYSETTWKGPLRCSTCITTHNCVDL